MKFYANFDFQVNVTDIINRAGNWYAYIVRKENLIDAEW